MDFRYFNAFGKGKRRCRIGDLLPGGRLFGRRKKRSHDRQSKEGFSKVEVDGYSKWCFTNSINSFYHPKSVNEALDKIVENYNEEEMEAAEKESREPKLLQDISCSVLRNTFCNRLAEAGVPLQATQAIMGHSNVHTTMSVYDSVEEDKLKEFTDKYLKELMQEHANT